MIKYYRGFWSFAPLPERTTHMVEANNEEEATEKLIKWALANKNRMDEPMDFEVEELDDIRLELARKIAVLDWESEILREYDRIQQHPKVLYEILRDYTNRLAEEDRIAEDYIHYGGYTRVCAAKSRSKMIEILRLIAVIL